MDAVRRYAVISGEIRDEFDFLVTMSKVVDLRDSGMLDGIVLSTWKSQVDEALRHNLSALDVLLVTYPDSFLMPSSNAAQAVYLRQAKLFLNGLRTVPDDAFVFRIRTDRSLDELGRVPLGSGADCLPSHRVSVHLGGSQARIIEMPFSFSDFTFFGPKRALERMVLLESSFHLIDRHVVTNSMWFVGPYLHSNPAIRDWFYYVDTWKLRPAMAKAGWASVGDWPDFFLQMLASYFDALASDFYVIADEAETTNASLEQLIASGQWANSVDAIVEGRLIQRTPNYERFLQAVSAARSGVEWSLTADAHGDMVEFGSRYFPDLGTDWIRPFVEVSLPTRRASVDGSAAAEVLFDGASQNTLGFVDEVKRYHVISGVQQKLSPRDGRNYYLALASETRYNAALAPQLAHILATQDWDTVLRGRAVAAQIENMLRQQLQHRFNLDVCFSLLSYYDHYRGGADFHGVPHVQKARDLVSKLVAARLATGVAWNDALSAIQNFRAQLDASRASSSNSALLDDLIARVEKYESVDLG